MTDAIRTLETLEIVGGAPCLDFANTINSRLYPEHDYLMQYSDLVGWGKKVGLLSPAQASQLQKGMRVGATANILEEAKTLRELLYRIFSNAAKGFEPAKKDMETFVASYAEAISHGHLNKQDDHYTTTWKLDESLQAVLWPVIYSAGELLLSEELSQVKECPGCGWLFLDASKNQSRRWCSMDTCGARDKMRRYQTKQRKKK